MSHSSRFSPPALTAFLACSALTAVAESAGAQGTEAIDDAFMLCTVYDHEIHANVIAFQRPSSMINFELVTQNLFVARLRATALANTPAGVFRDLPPVQLDENLVPLVDSLNGPEFGVDDTQGLEVAYTKKDPITGNWFLARYANPMPPFIQAWHDHWDPEEFPNPPGNPQENRWGPFATHNMEGPARAVYFRTPGDVSDTDKRLAYRNLEDALATEVVIDEDNPSARFWGHWVRIGEEDFILSTYEVAAGNVQVVLYDVTGQPPPPAEPWVRTIVTDGSVAARTDAWIELDPNDGEYTLAYVKTVGTATSIEVYKRDSVTLQWIHQYEFNATNAGDAPPNVHVQSPELFAFNNRLWIAFVTSDTPDFVTATRGNIRIARVREDAQELPFYKLLNDSSVIAKRTEPEVHDPQGEGPVVFYSRKAAQGDPNCAPDVNMLYRARTTSMPSD